MKNKGKQVIVISGTTSGIGKVLCDLYRAQGDTVLEVSRSADGEFAYPTDVADDSAVTRTVERIAASYGKIDCVISNAGYGLAGATETLDDEQIRRQTDVNFIGALNLARKLVPLLNKGGRVVFISSVCALFPLPYRSVYAATKAAITAAAEALYCELKPLGYKVCCILPGDIQTSFSANRVKCFSDDTRYGDAPTAALNYSDTRENKRMPLTRAARTIFKISTKCNRPFVIVGGKYKLLYFLQRFLPRKLVLNAVSSITG